MLPTTIGPLEEGNTPGACKLQFVAVEKVASFPQEVRGTLPNAIVLVEGAVWTTIVPTKFTQDFQEDWVRRDGDVFAQASVGFRLPKDRAALLHGLWRLKPGRYIVLHHDLNGSVRVLGTKDEPAMVRVEQVRHGGDPRREGNRYVVSVEVSRRTECPFYLATPPAPEVPGGSCPTLAQQIALVDWAAIEALLSVGQLAAAVTSLCETCPTLAVLIAAESWATIEGLLSGGQLSAAQASICSSLCELMDAAFVSGSGDPVLVMSVPLTGSGPLFVAGTTNGRTHFSNVAWGTFENYAEAYWTGSNWYVTDGNSVWTSTDDVPTPDLIDNWSGDAPYPVLSMDSGGLDASAIIACWSPEQVAAVLAALGASAEDATVYATDGTTMVLTVAPGGSESLPQSVIKHKDADDDDQVIAASNTEFVSGTLRPDTQIPRREIIYVGGTGTGLYATADRLLADTIPQVPIPNAQANVIHEYTASDTWTKPARLREVLVVAIGGGGGGGGGARGTVSTGGSGGSGATMVWRRIVAADLGPTETIAVGAGGAGGASRGSNGNGNNGTNGGTSSFGSLVSSAPGLGALGGTGATTIAATAAPVLSSCTPGFMPHGYNGAAGGSGARSGGGTSTAGSNGMAGFAACPGGGGAGGTHTTPGGTNTGAAGGGAFNAGILVAGPSGGAAGAGLAAGGVGGAGVNDVVRNLLIDLADLTNGIGTGGGGGGGASGVGFSGGNGGAGGHGAGGGGGGGAGAGSSGAGGAGGHGLVFVLEIFQ